jgi:hypothetical protein
MKSARSILEQLVAPLAPAAFLAEHWERGPLYLPGGAHAQDKVDLMSFDLAAFKRAAARIIEQPELRDYGMPALLGFTPGGYRPRGNGLEAAEIDAAYEAGATVSLVGAQLLDPRLASLAARLEREIAHAGSVHMQSFLSADKCGAEFHFDASPAIAVQLEGAKRWRYWPTRALAAPPEGLVPHGAHLFKRAYPWARVAPPDPAEMVEQVLRPGDILCLPGGTWHEASGVGHSLAITIEFVRRPMHAIVARRLEGLLMPRPSWREAPAPWFVEGDDLPGLPRVLEDCAARLDELRALVAELTPENLAAWSYPNHLALETEDEVPASATPADDELRPDDPLVAPHALTWWPERDADGSYVLVVSSASGTINLGVGALGLVDALARSTSFRAGEAMSWSADPGGSSWAETREALEGFVAHGLLRRDHDPGISATVRSTSSTVSSELGVSRA